ncbi:MAG TPA: GGDEF domain-containing protein [Vicinamibacterales bacterium]|jgi:diguanylate cyclase (GGDEF)-like protein
MDRVPGYAWLLVLAAVVLVTVASAVPLAPSAAAVYTAGQQTFSLERIVNPWQLAGKGALVVTGVLLLLFVYRRRLYILFWTAGWFLVSASLFLSGRSATTAASDLLTFGVAQFLGILSALFFVISADAYPTRPRIRRGYALILIAVLLWFALAPLALGASAVFAPGHVLMAGALAAAGVGHLVLLRQVRMLGAAVVGVALLLISATHVWIVLRVEAPGDPRVTSALVFTLVLYLITALGMQLMTFEDMTWELRRTNRRLEAAQSKLRRMVITDPLTGCRNRRFFDEIIGRELQRHRRYAIPMSVLFVDVDRFKAVNDTLGHDAGDRVLREVAAFLLSNIREADYVFRWGGDEFLILLSCAEEEALRRGLALQSDFARYAMAASLPAGVGLSIGCAEVPADAEGVMPVIRIADERMYENKRLLRRNRPHTQARASGSR